MADAKPEKGDGEEEALQVRVRACTRGAGAARRSSFLLAVARGGGHTLTRDARVPCRPRLSRRSSGTSRRCVSSLGWARGCRAAHARRVPVRPTAAAVTDATAFFFSPGGARARDKRARAPPARALQADGDRPPCTESTLCRVSSPLVAVGSARPLRAAGAGVGNEESVPRARVYAPVRSAKRKKCGTGVKCLR